MPVHTDFLVEKKVPACTDSEAERSKGTCVAIHFYTISTATILTYSSSTDGIATHVPLERSKDIIIFYTILLCKQ